MKGSVSARACWPSTESHMARGPLLSQTKQGGLLKVREGGVRTLSGRNHATDVSGGIKTKAREIS